MQTCRANFYKWVQAFKDGRESITDDLRSGRPVNVSTPEAVFLPDLGNVIGFHASIKQFKQPFFSLLAEVF